MSQDGKEKIKIKEKNYLDSFLPKTILSKITKTSNSLPYYPKLDTIIFL